MPSDEEDKRKKDKEESSSSSSDDSSDSGSDSEDSDAEVGPVVPPSALAATDEAADKDADNKGKDEEEDDDDGEPKAKRPRKKVLAFEKQFLEDLPNGDRYEKSFMHRDVVQHIVVSRSGGFVMTGSADGHVKFWKKDAEGFEFVKHFRAHLAGVTDMRVNVNGTLLITVSAGDKHGKVFDVQNFDMINILKFHGVMNGESSDNNTSSDTPICCEWVHKSDDVVAAVAVAFDSSRKILIFDGKGESVPIRVLEKFHMKPVEALRFNPHFNVCVSADRAGMIEYWHGPQGDYAIPDKRTVMFDSKLDTDLFELAKNKTFPLSLDVAPNNGKLFAAFCHDRKIRVFRFLSGKLYCVIDESLSHYIKLQSEKKIFQAMDFNRKISNEKDLEKSGEGQHSSSSSAPPPPLHGCNVVFDKTGNFILYPTLTGVKIVNIYSNKSCGVIGNGENLRFLNIALSQGSDDVSKPSSSAMPASIEQHVSDNPSIVQKGARAEPILFCTAHKKNRFYLFTRSSPKESGGDRDVFNEKPSQEERLAAVADEQLLPGSRAKLYENATIHTSLGDIYIKLFAKECPKTVENFCALARTNYYNNNVFHRVIKQFMIQTGDPTGIGTGGESSFGHEFEDEFHPKLRHDRPYTVSMANAGPNTNGSQFFVTVVPTPWLDNKHTVFGRVTKGMDVVLAISNVKTHPKSDKPYDDITTVSVSLKDPIKL